MRRGTRPSPWARLRELAGLGFLPRRHVRTEPERDERPRQDRLQPVGLDPADRGRRRHGQGRGRDLGRCADGRVGAGEPAPGVRDHAAQCRPSLVPMPDGGTIRSKTEMPIQPGPLAPLAFNPVAQDAGAVGGDWTWC